MAVPACQCAVGPCGRAGGRGRSHGAVPRRVAVDIATAVGSQAAARLETEAAAAEAADARGDARSAAAMLAE